MGNLSSFFVVALATTSLGYVLYYLWLRYGAAAVIEAGDSPYSMVAFPLLSAVVDSVLTSIATGIIVYGALRELQGQPAGLREVFRRSLPILGPVALLGLVATLGAPGPGGTASHG